MAPRRGDGVVEVEGAGSGKDVTTVCIVLTRATSVRSRGDGRPIVTLRATCATAVAGARATATVDTRHRHRLPWSHNEPPGVGELRNAARVVTRSMTRNATTVPMATEMRRTATA